MTDVDVLYRKHAPAAFRRARRMLGDEAEAREVVQEVFLSWFERPDQFAGRASASTFLYSVVTHQCLKRIRDQKNRARLVREKLPVQAQAQELAPDGHSMLRQLLSRMPEELAQVAVYHYADGLTHQDIARILGCSRRQVGNLLERTTQWVEEREA